MSSRRDSKYVYACVEGSRDVKYVFNPTECAGRAEPLMSNEQRIALSKLMSALLRHIPHEAGLTLDREGWVSLEDLVKGITQVWRNKELYSWVTERHIRAVAELDPKGRFEIRGSRIRARYGHSVKVSLTHAVDEDVKTLYHGTTARAWRRIRHEGILPGKRVWVHLTSNPKDAYETGRRHGNDVVILKIDANCLRKKGLTIHKASKAVWVVKHVPPECIEEAHHGKTESVK